jgi:hypothetical protein
VFSLPFLLLLAFVLAFVLQCLLAWEFSSVYGSAFV